MKIFKKILSVIMVCVIVLSLSACGEKEDIDYTATPVPEIVYTAVPKITPKATTPAPTKTPRPTRKPTPTPAPTKSSDEYLAYLTDTYKDYKEVPYGLDITKKVDLVGICYSTWFTAIREGGIYHNETISDILDGNGEWGTPSHFHYWAEPEIGFYTSDDKAVIRTHMTQLSEMGVDYIIVDNTNVQMAWKENKDWLRFVTKPGNALLDTIVEMRAEGKKTPYVVFWNKTSDGQNWDVVNAVYEEFHTVEKWKDCFVYWEGKPFMLTTSHVTEGAPKYEITTRLQWGLDRSLGVSEWSFLNIENKACRDENNFFEQICVCTAAQESYMSDLNTAHGRNHGIFMYEQWQNAFEYRPKNITITWWNEWCAQLFLDDNGNPRFVDNYNYEYSRDIEPVKGGHGDQYYQWTKQYISAYKNHKECPRLVEAGY